jgi:hypothetical protein
MTSVVPPEAGIHTPCPLIGLMVRSAAQRRVSNHGAAPSFETGAMRPPQDEAG